MDDDQVFSPAEARIAAVFFSLAAVGTIAVVGFLHLYPVYCCGMSWTFLIDPWNLLSEVALLVAGGLLAISARSLLRTHHMAPSIWMLPWVGAVPFVVHLVDQLVRRVA